MRQSLFERLNKGKMEPTISISKHNKKSVHIRVDCNLQRVWGGDDGLNLVNSFWKFENCIDPVYETHKLAQ